MASLEQPLSIWDLLYSIEPLKVLTRQELTCLIGSFAMLDPPQGFLFEDGQLVEEVCQVEPFVTLDAVDAIVDPAHIE